MQKRFTNACKFHEFIENEAVDCQIWQSESDFFVVAVKMPVSAEIASVLDALDAPAMLIRPEDQTVAAVNEAFARAYGRFRFEGKQCWEALHRAGPCPKTGLACPLAASEDKKPQTVEQTLYGSARTIRLTVCARPVLTADGQVLYWLETFKVRSGKEPFQRGLVGVSRQHRALMRALEDAALQDIPYVVVGEEGLGKELYARTVHENSARASSPFVAVDGRTLSGKDASKVLLGSAREPGLLRRAHGGTLFINDVQWVCPAVRQMLLNLLKTGCLPDGSPVSIRLAASSRESLVDEKTDALAAVLMRCTLHVAPLRERKEDIAPLAKFFLSGLAPVNTRTITHEAIKRLQNFDWPGNVRELNDVLAKAADRAGGTVTSALLELPVRTAAPFLNDGEEILPLSDMQDRYLLWAVNRFEGSRSDLAAKLGVSERTLYRLYAQGKKRCGG